MGEDAARSIDPPDFPTENNGNYALSGRIMLSAIVVLFFVVILMFAFHLYARFYLLRAARRRSSRNGSSNSRRTQLVFYIDPNTNAASATTRGLDARVLKSLPVFTFSSTTHPDSALECAVCLSEFEENESGRVLPKCNHSFHLECIDMWFHSHSTCPLCRTPVEEPALVSENPRDLVLTINDPSGVESGPNQSSDLCATCQHEEQAGTSAVAYRRKLSIEVPRRNTEGFEGESSGCDSGPSQSYKSPMSRMLSFKRILSRDRRGNGASSCPSPINAGNCGSISVSESDIERGGDEARQTHG
ncbi:RING-H2 finger protein ATL2-like [Durio zibethinus]|uniref:RING-type E3 ubiquitin transferase n=1 Tax=Durio zibethinus TaxID=66656 RepID=A0A6P5YM32_DURZI|nr:RING-H2 finger protein ATL2-like [Durio zibethinus]